MMWSIGGDKRAVRRGAEYTGERRRVHGAVRRSRRRKWTRGHRRSLHGARGRHRRRGLRSHPHYHRYPRALPALRAGRVPLESTSFASTSLSRYCTVHGLFDYTVLYTVLYVQCTDCLSARHLLQPNLVTICEVLSHQKYDASRSTS